MAKRKTKAQREAEQLAALEQRIRDIYSGACGRAMWCDDDFPCAEELSRIIPTVRDVFGERHPNWYVYQVRCLDRWELPGRVAEWLFELGFRADERWEPEEVA